MFLSLWYCKIITLSFNTAVTIKLVKSFTVLATEVYFLGHMCDIGAIDLVRTAFVQMAKVLLTIYLSTIFHVLTMFVRK